MESPDVVRYRWMHEGVEYSVVKETPESRPRLYGEYPPDIDAGLRAAAAEMLKLAEERRLLRAALWPFLSWYEDGIPSEPEQKETYYRALDAWKGKPEAGGGDDDPVMSWRVPAATTAESHKGELPMSAVRVPISTPEVLDELKSDSLLNRVRRCFSGWSAKIEQAGAQHQSLEPIAWRRMEFEAAAELISIAGAELSAEIERLNRKLDRVDSSIKRGEQAAFEAGVSEGWERRKAEERFSS